MAKKFTTGYIVGKGDGRIYVEWFDNDGVSLSTDDGRSAESGSGGEWIMIPRSLLPEVIEALESLAASGIWPAEEEE